MDNRPFYQGIDTYNARKSKGTEVTIFALIFFIVLIVSCYFGIKVFNLVKSSSITLSDTNIQYFIDVADEVSSGKAQVSWQEVAAINEVIYDGDLRLVEDSDVKNIANKFLKEIENNKYKILSFDDVLDIINFSDDQKESAKEYLDKIKVNSLYDSLYSEEDKISFLNSIEEQAIINYNTYGILPSITMAQAVLESGWGGSELAMEHNNLFGIKADSRWDGEVATLSTTENYSDVIEANFRKYNSLEESIIDHGLFLYSNERYSVHGVFDAKDYKSQAQALEDAGYSTAKDESGNLIYADKLISVVQKYNLMLYDTKAQLT